MTDVENSDIPRPDHDQIMECIQRVLAEFDAHDIVTIPLQGKVSYADSLVIATGTSSRQLGAIAGKLATALKTINLYVPPPEGLTNKNWVLVDASDIVVHLFQSEVRDYYRLEDIWSDHMPQRAQQ